MKTPALLPLIAAFALALTACGRKEEASTAPASAGAKPLKIVVIPKGTTHEFWKAIHAGARKAAEELSAQGTPVELVWKGPLREDDREQQIQTVESFIGRGVDGIVLAPLDANALAGPVQQASQRKIPVVIIDSALNSDIPVSTVATNNHKGGEKAAERLGSLMNGKGKVLLLRYAVGSASTEAREKGFLDTLKAKFPDIVVVSSDQHAGPTRESAYQASQNLLNRHGKDIQGIFTSNESTTAGMILALCDAGLNGKVRHVGFDSGQLLVEALQKGDVQGLVVQDPWQMGYLGVTTMVSHLKGGTVSKQTDTAVGLITPEDMAAPESQRLLHPPRVD